VSVRRAIPIVHAADVPAARAFYADLLGFDVGMEQDGMDMYVSSTVPTTQVIVAATAGPVADEVVGEAALSVEVADVRSVYAEAQSRGLEIVHPLTDEAWGITRFFVKDPDGTVVNVTTHTADLA
jgi:catechol 2,3-dioxygenase-like lactoylglutathione lyase family enzyme